jgi:hypothetical protein
MTTQGLILFGADAPRDLSRPPRRCKVGKLLDAATDTQRDMLLERLHAPSSTGWTDDELSHALDRGGHRVSASMLSRHRTGACPCDRLTEGA